MSMYDKSYCNTTCDQQDCERNLRFNKPETKYYYVGTFDDVHDDHKNCIWKVRKKK